MPLCKKHKKEGGYFVLLVLVFGSIFLLMITSLAGLIVNQKKLSRHNVNNETALQIAEAGLDYYRWYLAHFPEDTTNGTTTPQPYVHDYHDPEGGKIGAFSLYIDGNEVCNEITSIDITSVGSTTQSPSITRTVYGRYARPSVAEYAYIINSNVWAGSDRDIVGPYHSNGGIRMDGTNNSSVTSGVTDWLCTSSFGCSPDQTVDGVFGAGPNSNLWEFPVIPVDFAGLTVDLANMKDQASSSGQYFGPSSNYGYHVVFRNDGTFDLYDVTNTYNIWQYSSDDGWHQARHTITGESFIDNYPIPSDCGLIFIEDKVWLEGVVSEKVTIAAADVTTPSVDPTIILQDDITYTATDGSVGLTAIAEEDVLIALDSPEDMELNGIFMAQNGHFGRNHYRTTWICCWYDYDVPSAYDSYVQQDELDMNGTIVSNGRVGTKWSSGGTFLSGYNQRTNSYDRDLATDPPPLTPYVSDNYTFIEWRENIE